MAFLDFFRDVGNRINRGLTSAFDTAKQILPGVYQGVKKGITFGRNVVELGKDVLNRARAIPGLGQVASIVDPILTTADQAVTAAEKATGVADQVINTVKNAYPTQFTPPGNRAGL